MQYIQAGRNNTSKNQNQVRWQVIRCCGSATVSAASLACEQRSSGKMRSWNWPPCEWRPRRGVGRRTPPRAPASAAPRSSVFRGVTPPPFAEPVLSDPRTGRSLRLYRPFRPQSCSKSVANGTQRLWRINCPRLSDKGRNGNSYTQVIPCQESALVGLH